MIGIATNESVYVQKVYRLFHLETRIRFTTISKRWILNDIPISSCTDSELYYIRTICKKICIL